MDSFEFNKIAGAVLAAMLAAVVIGIIGDTVIPAPHDDRGEPVYLVAVPESDDPAADEDAEEMAAPTVLALLPEADVAAGEGVTKKCAACHSFDEGGPTKIGPNLWNIVNKQVANAADYSYSDALAGLGGEWDYERLDAFFANPKDYAPGTKMSFAGLKKIEDRANLIAWLRVQSPSPAPLPVVEETPPAEEASSAVDEVVEAAATAAETATETLVETAEKAAEMAEETAENIAEAVEGTAEDTAATAEATAGTAENSAPEAEKSATAAAETAPAPAEEAAPAAETPPAETTAPEPETVVASDLGTKLANADIAAGETAAKKCLACHNIAEGLGKKIGPNLWDVVGRPVASAEGFKYSEAMTEFGGTWTYERLSEFLEAPKTAVPGTKMGFPGVSDEQDRIDLIAWLRRQSGNPQPIPE